MITSLTIRDALAYLRHFLNERADRHFLNERADARQLEPHEVAYVLKTMAREILPGAGLVGRCEQLDLFTDWTVHGEIDRSPTGQAAIATIAEAIPLHGRTPERDNKWLEEQINGAISFASLRLDLVAVCQRFDLPDFWFASWEGWQRFAKPLCFEVSGRSIRLGERGRAAREATDRIEATVLAAGDRPRAVQVCFDQDWKPWWRVETQGDKHILMQVLLGGFRLQDFPVPAGSGGMDIPIAVAGLRGRSIGSRNGRLR